MLKHIISHVTLLYCFLCFILLSLSPPSSVFYFVEAAPSKPKTHYEVLELKDNNATLKDIKKAYRKLAVQHHPDRNIGNEESATIKFREINEAYEVLSDDTLRREYDRSLKSGFGSGTSYNTGGNRQQRQSRPHRDPFAQFNDVFKNDPFFAEAFKSMDDLFDKHFSNNNANTNTNNKRGGGGSNQQQKTGTTVDKKSNEGGWMWNTVKKIMPNINIQIETSTSSNRGGQQTYTSTSRSYGSGNNNNNNNNRRARSTTTSSTSTTTSTTSTTSTRRGGGSTTSTRSSSSTSSSSSTYTSRSTKTIIQNGQRITIQSLEKDGNKIEEKYIGEKLIERKINGMVEEIGRIANDERQQNGEEF